MFYENKPENAFQTVTSQKFVDILLIYCLHIVDWEVDITNCDEQLSRCLNLANARKYDLRGQNL